MQSQGKSIGASLLRNAIGSDKTLLGCIKHIQWMVLMALLWLHEKKKPITLVVQYTYMPSLFPFYSLHLLLIKNIGKHFSAAEKALCVTR